MINWDSIKNDVALSKILNTQVSDKTKLVFEILDDWFTEEDTLHQRGIENNTYYRYDIEDNILLCNRKIANIFIEKFPYDYSNVQDVICGYIYYKYNVICEIDLTYHFSSNMI